MSEIVAKASGVCIYTPETFVELLIRGLSGAFEGVQCTSDVGSLLKKAKSKELENILIYSETLSRPALARLVLKVTSSNAKLNIFYLEDSVAPKLHKIHPAVFGEEHPSVLLEDLNFSRIIELIRGGFQELERENNQPRLKLTKHQWAVLRFVGEGLSNAEIARRRNCTPRAVETILNRTMVRLGIDPALGARGRTVAVIKFLESAK